MSPLNYLWGCNVPLELSFALQCQPCHHILSREDIAAQKIVQMDIATQTIVQGGHYNVLKFTGDIATPKIVQGGHCKFLKFKV